MKYLKLAFYFAMMVVVILMITGDKSYSQYSQPFSDVPGNHWAAKEVCNVVEKGIMKGDGVTFQGNRTVTRYELAIALSNTLDYIEAHYEKE